MTPKEKEKELVDKFKPLKHFLTGSEEENKYKSNPECKIKLDLNNHVTVVEKENNSMCVQTGKPCGFPCYDKCPVYDKKQQSWSRYILQTQFYRENGIEAFNSQGEPDIDYVQWLESKIISK